MYCHDHIVSIQIVGVPKTCTGDNDTAFILMIKWDLGLFCFSLAWICETNASYVIMEALIMLYTF